MTADRVGRHEVLLPINHEDCNFRDEKGQVMKERKNLHKSLSRVLHCVIIKIATPLIVIGIELLFSTNSLAKLSSDKLLFLGYRSSSLIAVCVILLSSDSLISQSHSNL